MVATCVNCRADFLTREPSYAGQSAPRFCDDCFIICFPNFFKKYKKLNEYKAERIRTIVRLRPDGQCFMCGKIKQELMEDPNDPTKGYERMYIRCNECEQEIEEKYGPTYKYQY